MSDDRSTHETATETNEVNPESTGHPASDAGREMTGGSDGAFDGGTGGHAPGAQEDVYGNESTGTPSTEPHPGS